MKFAAYIRVSTSRQASENDSLDGQRIAIERWAVQNGHKIVKYYNEEAHSGYKGTRPELEKMLSHIQTAEIKYQGVVVYALSRFSRNESTRLRASGIIKEHGLEFKSVTEPYTGDPVSTELLNGIVGNINQFQSSQNSRVVSDRKAEAVEKGYYVGGVVPYGYKSVPAPETTKNKKILAIDSEQAEIVKRIFRLALEGEYGQPYGVKKISAFLNSSGIPARSSYWTIMKVDRILTDPIYIGKREYAVEARKHRGNYSPIYYQNPPIVDEETFEKVQIGLAERAPQKTTKDKGIRSKSILTGLLKCGRCNKNLVLSSGKSGQYYYYKCSRRIKEDINVCSCPNLPKLPLENKVKELISEQVLQEEILSEDVQSLKTKHKEICKTDKQRLLALQAKISKLDGQYEKLIMFIADGELELDEPLKNKIDQLKLVREGLKREVRSLKEKIELPIKKFGQTHIALFAQAAKNVLLGSDSEATKALLIAMIKQIVVFPTHVKLQGGLLPLAAMISRVGKKTGTGLNQVPIFVSKWRRRCISEPST